MKTLFCTLLAIILFGLPSGDPGKLSFVTYCSVIYFFSQLNRFYKKIGLNAVNVCTLNSLCYSIFTELTFRNATESNYILGAIIIQYAVLVFIHAISIYFGKLPLIAANKLCVFLFLPIEK